MSLRIRRGTDAQRSGVTFLEGELVYTTDTKKLYLGDGTTAGGIAVDSTTGSISQLADVNINGIQTGQILQWDGAQFIAGDDAGDQDSIFGADSTLLVDATNSSINLDGTVKGHIIPDQNETYNLGSASNKFNDLFLSGTTITLGTATISSDGSEITLSQPINATVKSTGDVDTNDNSITNTAAGGNIIIAPTAGKKLLVNDTVGGTAFAVDTTLKSVDVDNGYGLKLATFSSAEYSAITPQTGQIVFDDPSKGLKIYNGSAWVQVQGSGGGGAGVVEGQTYDININGDIVGDDSTLIIDTQNKNVAMLSGNFSGLLEAGILSGATINSAGTITGSIVNATTAGISGTLTADAIIVNGTATVNTIAEKTADQGVLIDGLLIKDNTITGATVTGVNVVASTKVTSLNADITGIATINIANITRMNGDVLGSVTGDAHIIGNITGGDSSVFFDGVSNTVTVDTANITDLNATRINSDDIKGSFSGSVFAEDSTLLVDGINGNIFGDVIGSVNTTQTLLVTSNENAMARLTGNTDTGVTGPRIEFHTSDGTVEAKTTVVGGSTGTHLGEMRGLGYDGTDYSDAGLIRVGVDLDATVSTGVVPGRLVFITANSAGALANIMTFNSAGGLGIGTSRPEANLHVKKQGTNAGNAKIDGHIQAGVQTISGPGAIDLDTTVTEITTTGADAYTLANGVTGQIKVIVMTVDGGDATLTPTTLATGTTIAFDAVADNITLVYGALGWMPIAVQGAVIA